MNERTNERARVSSEYSPPLMDRRVGLSLERERVEVDTIGQPDVQTKAHRNHNRNVIFLLVPSFFFTLSCV